MQTAIPFDGIAVFFLLLFRFNKTTILREFLQTLFELSDKKTSKYRLQISATKQLHFRNATVPAPIYIAVTQGIS